MTSENKMNIDKKRIEELKGMAKKIKDTYKDKGKGLAGLVRDNYPQVDLPDDWMRQITEAKVQHDKWGVICTILILPAAWARDFVNKQNELEHVSIWRERLTMYGADIFFGPVDVPMVGGDADAWSNMEYE